MATYEHRALNHRQQMVFDALPADGSPVSSTHIARVTGQPLKYVTSALVGMRDTRGIVIQTGVDGQPCVGGRSWRRALPPAPAAPAAPPTGAQPQGSSAALKRLIRIEAKVDAIMRDLGISF